MGIYILQTSPLTTLFPTTFLWGNFSTYKPRNVLVTQSCLTLCDPMDCVAHQAPLSMGFSRQEYESRVPCPSPGDLLDPEIKLGFNWSTKRTCCVSPGVLRIPKLVSDSY